MNKPTHFQAHIRDQAIRDGFFKCVDEKYMKACATLTHGKIFDEGWFDPFVNCWWFVTNWKLVAEFKKQRMKTKNK